MSDAIPVTRPAPARETVIRRCVGFGMGVNALLALGKLLVGLLAHSRALVTDALHSLSDFGTDGLILLGSRYWSRPPDSSHPYGHRRIETLVSAAVGGSLALGGVLLGWDALRSLASSDVRPSPGPLALVMALLSIGIKEGLYRWALIQGRKTHSVALQANAWHHRSDAWSSIPVALAVGGAWWNPAWSFLDSVAAFVVSLLLLKVAYRIVRPALDELTELGASSEFTADLEAIARGVPGVLDVHAIRTRYAGSRLLVDLHVLVHPATSVREGHAISSLVCDAIHLHASSILEVLVHIEPYEAIAGFNN